MILTPDDSGIGKYEFLDFLKKYFNKENASPAYRFKPFIRFVIRFLSIPYSAVN